MKAKIYVGAKKYALYIGRKIIEKTLEFLTLPASFISKKIQDLKSLVLYGNSVQANLPDGYTQLEYIESTGTQGIDTGINPTVAKSTEIQIKLLETVITGSGSGFGLNLSLNVVNTTPGYWRINGVQTNITRQVGKIFNITLKQTSQGRYYNINGEEGYGSNSEPSGSFCIGVLGESPSYNLKAKWYYCKILENNQLVQNLIPARRNSDNVLGMYDTISNTFLTNAGTGEFIAGGVVVPTPSTPIPIESVGDKTKNLFDGKTDIVIGKYIVSATGVVGDSRYNYYCDTYFEVKPNISYVFWGEKKADNTLSAYNRIHWYNSAKTFISSAQYGQSAKCVGIAPSNAKYARISCNTLDNNLTLTQEDVNPFNWYFGEGDTLTGYEPYGYKVPIEIKGKNLADINSVIVGEYVNARSTDADFGSIKYNMAWARTDYIEIEPNTTYTIYFDDIVAASSAGLCIYDKNKNVLDGYSTNSLKTNTHNITTPENSKYLIMSISRTGSITRELAIYKQDGTYANIPYTPPVTQTLYLNEPLRKIGEYADTINITKSKNLFDENSMENIWISVSGAIATDGRGHWIELGDANTLCFICDTTSSNPYSAIALYDENRNFITDSRKVLTNSGFKKLTIDITQFPTAKYAVCSSIYRADTVINYAMVAFEDINAEDYVPYGSTVTVTRNVGKVIYTEANDWRVQNTGLANSLAPYIYGQNPADMNIELPTYPNLLRCDVLTNALAGMSDGATMNGISPNVLRNNLLMNVELDKFPTLDDWKEYVRLNPLVIYYVLNAPTTTETYSLPQPIQLQQDTLTIDTDTNIKPSKTLITGDVDHE